MRWLITSLNVTDIKELFVWLISHDKKEPFPIEEALLMYEVFNGGLGLSELGRYVYQG